MRKLLLTRGIPGSGKSTWLKSKNLEAYTICPDDLRLVFSSPILNALGKIGINQSNDKRVWELVYKTVEERMDRGDLIVVDATHKKQSDLGTYRKLAQKYFYDIAVVDFSDVPLETCLERNMLRSEYKQVPEDIIKNHHNIVSQHVLPKDVTKINPNDNSLEYWLESSYKHYNLNSFEKIHIIGDIQGCFEPIKEYFKDGIKSSEYYIFTGDLLDRGIQNGEVLEWVIDELVDRSNVILLMGNHERHLLRYVSGLEFKGQEFQTNTLPQIQHIKIDKIRKLLSKLQDCFVFYYGQEQVFVSHGGIGKIPHLKMLPYIHSKTFWNGVGVYGDPIDEFFTKENNDWLQFHGHRNRNSLPLVASERSWNLEGKVEFGGNLRIAELSFNDSKVSIKPIEIKNSVYKTREECLRDY